jgi:hypothetical protein
MGLEGSRDKPVALRCLWDASQILSVKNLVLPELDKRGILLK